MVPQPPGQIGHGPARAMLEAGGGDPDGEREVPAQPQHLAYGLRLLVSAFAHDPLEQLGGVRLAQHVHRQRLGAVQVDEPPPAGDQDEGAGASRQQGAHVLGVESVVQYGEHPAIGQLGAPEGAPLGRGDRDAVGGHPELAEECLQRRGGVDRLPARRVGLQVDEEAGRPDSGRPAGGPRGRREWSCRSPPCRRS